MEKGLCSKEYPRIFIWLHESPINLLKEATFLTMLAIISNIEWTSRNAKQNAGGIVGNQCDVYFS